jgi:quinol monooxygenase YgiN
MSVIITLLVQANPDELEAFAASNQDEMRGIAETAKEHGVIAHRFYGSGDGRIMVADEWPDVESFQRFFETTQDRIGPMLLAAGAASKPEITFWRKLDTHDDVGWES